MTDPQVQIRYDLGKLLNACHNEMAAQKGNQFKQAVLLKVAEHIAMAVAHLRSVDTAADIS